MPIKTELTREALEKSKFFSCDDEAERITATSIEEVIEQIADRWHPGVDRPEIVTVYGFSPIKPNFNHLRPLEHCLEILDEEYGDPDQDTKSTTAMIEAEMAFIEAIKTGYSVYMCGVDGFAHIPTAEFFKE